MEAFPQVVQEGSLTRVGVQKNKVLDAHTIPGGQGGLHVPQDLVTPFIQALCPSRNGDRVFQSSYKLSKTTFVLKIRPK